MNSAHLTTGAKQAASSEKESVPVEILTVVQYKPFQVPNFSTQLGWESSVKVADLPQEVVDGLAARWLVDLYMKAGKRNPFSKSAFRTEHDSRGPG